MCGPFGMRKMVSNTIVAAFLLGFQYAPALFFAEPRPAVRPVRHRLVPRTSLHHVLGVEEHQLEGGECQPSRISVPKCAQL